MRKIILLILLIAFSSISLAQEKEELDRALTLTEAGAALQKLGRHEEALKNFDEALKIVDHPKIKYLKGVSLEKLKKYKFALNLFEDIRENIKVKKYWKDIRKRITRIEREIEQLGALQIASIPSGASVYINGSKVEGLTPLLIDGLESGTYTVYLEKNLFHETIKVKITKKSYVKLELELRADTCEVSFITQPSFASIFLDGNVKGVTPLTLKNIMPGIHEVIFEKPGFVKNKINLNLTPKEHIEINQTLLRNAEEFIYAAKKSPEKAKKKAMVLLMPEKKSIKGMTIARFGTLGTGVAGVITGIIFSVLSNDQVNSIYSGHDIKNEQDQSMGITMKEAVSFQDDARSFRTNSYIFYGIGGTALISSLILFFTNNENGETNKIQ